MASGKITHDWYLDLAEYLRRHTERILIEQGYTEESLTNDIEYLSLSPVLLEEYGENVKEMLVEALPMFHKLLELNGVD